MFDRHQAEITVIQVTLFRCISLWVYHGILPCPILSAKPAYAISSHNCLWNLSLPSGASLWNGTFGRVEGQNTTIVVFFSMLWILMNIYFLIKFCTFWSCAIPNIWSYFISFCIWCNIFDKLEKVNMSIHLFIFHHIRKFFFITQQKLHIKWTKFNISKSYEQNEIKLC